ncbi:unnamed protein product, partial [Hapterophycus canaliculatus]
LPPALQDPSIWTSPSAEELKIVGDLEPIPSQPLDPYTAARYGEGMGQAAWPLDGGGYRTAAPTRGMELTNELDARGGGGASGDQPHYFPRALQQRRQQGQGGQNHFLQSSGGGAGAGS